MSPPQTPKGGGYRFDPVNLVSPVVDSAVGGVAHAVAKSNVDQVATTGGTVGETEAQVEIKKLKQINKKLKQINKEQKREFDIEREDLQSQNVSLQKRLQQNKGGV
jgi:hypothetical protein